MDALKSATNIGTTTTSQQSGQEPVSGEEGAGTATQPFDQGNAEGNVNWSRELTWVVLISLCSKGKEGAGPRESMNEALDDTKKAASDAVR